MARCACGKTMNRFALQCKHCHKKSMVDSAIAYIAAEKVGACPHHPQHPLVFNNSLASTLRW